MNTNISSTLVLANETKAVITVLINNFPSDLHTLNNSCFVAQHPTNASHVRIFSNIIVGLFLV